MRHFPPPPDDPRKTPGNDSPWTMLYIIGGLFAFVICFIFGVVYFTGDADGKNDTGVARRIFGLEGDQKKKPVLDDFPACRVSYRGVDKLSDTALAARALNLEEASANVFDYIVRMRRGYHKVVELNGESEEAISKFMIDEQNIRQLRDVLQEYIRTGLRITGETNNEIRDGYYNILNVPGRYIEEQGNSENKIKDDPLMHYFSGNPRDAFLAFNLLLSEVREFERNRFIALFPEQ